MSSYLYLETARRHGWKALVLALLAPFVSAICGTFARTQSEPAQSFDVVSIKLNHSLNAGMSLGDSIPGKFTATNFSLLFLIEYAYDVKRGQIEGLLAWAETERYDVDAKMDDAVAEGERSIPRDEREKLARTRVQFLLADRFGLKLHHETKDMPALVLTVAKGGPKLSEAAAKSAPGEAHPLPPGSLGMRMKAGDWIIAANQSPLRNLINPLSAQPEMNGRILLDRTGLTGKYSFTLQWASQNLSGAGAATDSPGPSLFTALEEQLGLRLESTKAPVDVLIIDHVEQPSPN
jgi:uncharacterized protein (TIGR03435 family)